MDDNFKIIQSITGRIEGGWNGNPFKIFSIKRIMNKQDIMAEWAVYIAYWSVNKQDEYQMSISLIIFTLLEFISNDFIKKF